MGPWREVRTEKALPDALDVRLHAVRVVEGVALLDLRVDLATDAQLLRLADEDEVLAAGDRIGGAAREPEVERGYERECETPRHAHDFTAADSALRAASRTVQGNKKGSRSCLGYRVCDRLQVAAGVFAGLAAALPRVYFCLNRSTLPAVSTIFWRPV